jgi:hypothetical protein
MVDVDSPLLTVHRPQQILVKINFGFHFGKNFHIGLQIVVNG